MGRPFRASRPARGKFSTFLPSDLSQHSHSHLQPCSELLSALSPVLPLRPALAPSCSPRSAPSSVRLDRLPPHLAFHLPLALPVLDRHSCAIDCTVLIRRLA